MSMGTVVYPNFRPYIAPHLKVNNISLYYLNYKQGNGTKGISLKPTKLTLKHQSSEYLYESFLILCPYFSISGQLQRLPLLTDHLTSSKQEMLKAKQFVRFNQLFYLWNIKRQSRI